MTLLSLHRGIIAAVASLLATIMGSPASPSDDAWQALRRGGTVALLRHARAPGTGDPANFRLDDCRTQRNLSAEGREQSARIGEAFAARGIAIERVLSSRWCRALETARLAFGARTEPFPPLDSFFADRGQRDAQTERMRETIAAWKGRVGVLVLVTHQVNITALTGIFLQEGEAVVLRPSGKNGFELVGRVEP